MSGALNGAGTTAAAGAAPASTGGPGGPPAPAPEPYIPPVLPGGINDAVGVSDHVVFELIKGEPDED